MCWASCDRQSDTVCWASCDRQSDIVCWASCDRQSDTVCWASCDRQSDTETVGSHPYYTVEYWHETYQTVKNHSFGEHHVDGMMRGQVRKGSGHTNRNTYSVIGSPRCLHLCVGLHVIVSLILCVGLCNHVILSLILGVLGFVRLSCNHVIVSLIDTVCWNLLLCDSQSDTRCVGFCLSVL